MCDRAPLLPQTDALEKRLAYALRCEGSSDLSFRLIRREPIPFSTTFPNEIVTCRLGRGKFRRIFCKYSGNINYTGHGHRGGVSYEVEVYRRILRFQRDLRPRFYGGYIDPQTGESWLFLECLDGSLPIQKLNKITVMEQAARWVARLHSMHKRKAGNLRFRFLNRYDRGFYLGWIRRTKEFAGPLHKRFPWLRRLCKDAEDLMAPLLACEPTIIHGEFYPPNILFHRGRVCPVDWESAAYAAGVIDLATLTEGWGIRMTTAIIKAYIKTRWPEGPPKGFEDALRAARLYMNFRWVGDEVSATQRRDRRGHFARLLSLWRQSGGHSSARVWGRDLAGENAGETE